MPQAILLEYRWFFSFSLSLSFFESLSLSLSVFLSFYLSLLMNGELRCLFNIFLWKKRFYDQSKSAESATQHITVQ